MDITNLIKPLVSSLPRKTEEITPQVTKVEEIKTPDYQESKEFNLWVKYYTDPKEKETYGNATQSYIKAYKLDPIRQYASARVLAHRNVNKVNFLARDYAESHGMTFPKTMDVLINKFIKSDSARWAEIFLDITEYRKQKPETSGAVNNTQVNVYNLDSDEVKNFNRDFLKFIESR